MARTTRASLEKELREAREITDEKSWRRLTRAVDRLVALRTEAALGILLGRITDTENDIQEVVVRGAESFPPGMYASGVARELLPLFSRAPYWTSILVMGIVQSEPHVRVLSARLIGAGPEIQDAVRGVVARVREQRDDLNAQTERLLAAMLGRRSLTRTVATRRANRKR